MRVVTPRGPMPPLVFSMLPDGQRRMVHPLCRLPRHFCLMSDGETIPESARFTRPDSPAWTNYTGLAGNTYNSETMHIHARLRDAASAQSPQERLSND
jgi:hypothetical protein